MSPHIAKIHEAMLRRELCLTVTQIQHLWGNSLNGDLEGSLMASGGFKRIGGKLVAKPVPVRLRAKRTCSAERIGRVSSVWRLAA